MAAQSLPRVNRSSARDTWLIAWVLTLLLHAAVLLVVRGMSPPGPPSTIRRPEPIRLVFASGTPGKRSTEQPRVFTELPPDRADAAPKKADFLSNVTSRARDRVPGGDAATPRKQGEADAPMVKLESEGGPSRASTVPLPPRTNELDAPRTAESPQRSELPAQAPVGATGTRLASPQTTGRDTIRLTGDGALRGAIGSGNSDIDQPEMANPGGNASLTGDVSLNTTAWNYAPWLQRFSRQVMRRWIPPPAYSLGILKDGGWGVFVIEISRSGKVLRFERLEEQGHPSLIDAAEGALRYVDPIEPLPADFPEPTLILRVRMIYPRIRPR